MTLKKIDNDLVRKVLRMARDSPRKRAVYCLHEPGVDYWNRFINAFMEGTYVRPHKHENPDKTEVFTILHGCVAIPTFDDEGWTIDCAILSDAGCRMVEITPRTWHSLIPLSRLAAVFEMKDMGYDPKTDKILAPWAPSESEPLGIESKLYLDNLASFIRVNYL